MTKKKPAGRRQKITPCRSTLAPVVPPISLTPFATSSRLLLARGAFHRFSQSKGRLPSPPALSAGNQDTVPEKFHSRQSNGGLPDASGHFNLESFLSAQEEFHLTVSRLRERRAETRASELLPSARLQLRGVP